MTRRRAQILILTAALLSTAALAACGTENIDLPAGASAQERKGAELFVARCAGCHTLSVAGAEGSAFDPNDREIKDGPNFDQRTESRDQVLYAIRNGGFSSGPMPQNIVVGADAEAVAAFVARYAGSQRPNIPSPQQR
jgi:mono/diheme cytochrome c family protein